MIGYKFYLRHKETNAEDFVVYFPKDYKLVDSSGKEIVIEEYLDKDIVIMCKNAVTTSEINYYKKVGDHKDRKEIRLYLGSACNFNCSYCIEQCNGNSHLPNYDEQFVNVEKTIEALDKLVVADREEYETNVVRIQFFGGEPLLYFDSLKKIVDHLKVNKEFEFIFVIISNGSLLNEEITNYCIDNKIKIALSWDGIETDRDYNVLEDEEVLNCFKKLHANHLMGISNVVSYKSRKFKENNEYLHNIFNDDDLAIDFKMVRLTEYPFEEYNEFFNDLTDEIYKSGYYKTTRMKNFVVNSLKNIGYIINKDYSIYLKNPIGCRAFGENSYTISYNGDLLFCDSVPIDGKSTVGGINNVYCNILKDPYIKKPREKLLPQYNEVVKICEECLAKNVCGYKCLHDDKNVSCKILERASVFYYYLLFDFLFNDMVEVTDVEKIRI